MSGLAQKFVDSGVSAYESGRRRRRRIVWGVMSGLVILSLLFAGLSAWAINSQQTASRAEANALLQRDEARRQAHIAFLRQLGAQSIAHLSDQFDLAALLSLEAARLANALGDSFESRNSLLRALEHSPQLTTFLRGHIGPVNTLVFSPDGKTLASGSDDGSIILWDVASRQSLGEPVTSHASSVYSVAFSPDSRTLASGNDDGSIILWDVASRQPLGEPLVGHTNIVYSVAFDFDGKLLASGSEDGCIILWDVASRQRLDEPLTDCASPVNSIAFSPDGKTLASGDDDGNVILWDVASRQMLGQPLTGHTSIVCGATLKLDSQIACFRG